MASSNSSSSSSVPPRVGGRVNEMTQQEDWIARKKAEIEARKNKGEGGEGGGGEGGGPGEDTRRGQGGGHNADGKFKKGFGSKNRWGFKGKSSNPVEPEEPPKPLAFVNDGSFLDKFKKMQETKSQAPSVRPVSTPVEVKKEVSCTQTSQEQEWYKEALARAREIASSKASPSLPVTSPGLLVKSEPAAISPAAAVDTVEASSSSSSSKAWSPPEQEDLDLPTVADELASLVAVNGDIVEIMAREMNMEAEELQFLQNATGELYLKYRAKVESLRKGFSDEGKRVRKGTRWGSEDEKVVITPAASTSAHLVGKSPDLVAYAQRVFGRTDLDPHQWKQCSDQMKMSLVYRDMLVKQQEMNSSAQQGKRKYEYDSDEDTEGGTWEHKARKLEMEKTAREAQQLTERGSGRHHIGDFIPPKELSKFLAKYEAIRNGEVFEESDYQENKLTEENMGFKMLQKMGWNEGSGLGANAQGITAPVNQGNQSGDKKGLGILKPHDLEGDDDEFDAYRKRMMLAYRFRPNPLNNPRRAYY